MPPTQQADPSALFDAWDDHCGRPRKAALCDEQSGAAPPLAITHEDDTVGSTELLGDEEERRSSWRRRFK
jgi:hypothetical protein